ncbi:MAG: hypothetical protein AAGA20_04780 [Planctomycetota bacterium]
MNRALPFLVLVAAMAGGLVYFALQTGHRRPSGAPDASESAVESAPSRNPEPERPADVNTTALVELPTSRGSAALGDGPVERWEVIPMNSVGQLVPEATMTATQGSTVLRSQGRTEWTDIASGQWELVIESEGNPTWKREMVLAPKERRRTAAFLGEEIRIEGAIVDTNGEQLARTPVFLLPPGVSHPSRQDMEPDPDNPRRTARATNGAVTAEIMQGGRFRARLPDDGKWRLSVGPPGAARWTQQKPSELTYGGPDRAAVTVPAYSRLRFEFEGPVEERPSQVSAFIYDAERAQQTLEREAEYAAARQNPMSIADAQREAKRRAMQSAENGKLDRLGYATQDSRGGSSTGTARRAVDEASDFAYRAGQEAGEGKRALGPSPILEPGWRMIRSARVSDTGETILPNLEAGSDLRFYFTREQERHVTAASYRIAAGRTSVAKVRLPPPGTSTPNEVDNRAAVSIALGEQDGDVERVSGVVWGF